jgi:hypothetical protein
MGFHTLVKSNESLSLSQAPGEPAQSRRDPMQGDGLWMETES